MKNIFLLLLITILTAMHLNGQELNCSDFLNGHYIIPRDYPAPQWTIIRLDSLQKEVGTGDTDTVEFHVKWIDECIYTLTPVDEKILFDSGIPPNSTLQVEILETGKNKYYKKSTFSFSELEIFSDVIRVDTVATRR